MAQRNSGRIDRFAQIIKQEEIIAKKRQEILEKQRTTQLAKAVAAAQNLASKIKSAGAVVATADTAVSREVDEAVAAVAAATPEVVVPPVVPVPEKEEQIKDSKSKTDEPPVTESPKPLTTTTTTSTTATTTTSTTSSSLSTTNATTTTTSTTPLNSLPVKTTGKISFGIKRMQPAPAEQPPPKVMNSFCNDGSFLDHFKKILEKHEKPKPVAPPLPMLPVVETPAEVELTNAEINSDEQQMQQNENFQMQQQQQQQHQQQQQQTIPPPPTMPAAAAAQFGFNANLLQQQMMLPHSHQQHHHQQQQQHFAQQHHHHMQQQQQQLHHHHQQQMQIQQQLQQQQLQHQIQQQQQQQEQQHLLQQHHQQQQQQQLQQQQQQQTQLSLPTTLANYTPPPPAVPQPISGAAAPLGIPISAAFFTNSPGAATGVPPPPQLVPPPPPPSATMAAAAAAAAAVAMLMPPSAAVPTTVAPPPPPPPPQLPLALASLAPIYIPAPEPMQLNAIPAPKEFDLNAIPKPQLNLEAIQVPSVVNSEQQQQHQQFQQPQQPDNNDHNCIPASVEKLIDLVVDNGDEYEDKLRANRNELHPAMWFLFDKNCEQYYKYRQQLNEQRQQRQQQQQRHCMEQQLQIIHNKQPPLLLKHQVDPSRNSNETHFEQQQQLLHSSRPNTSGSHVANVATNEAETASITISAADKYDPEFSGGDVDSDDEYMRGMMDRNRDNIKRRIECRNELSEEEREQREHPTVEEEEEEERRRNESKKKLRKSRWGEKVVDAVVVEDLDSSSSGMPTTSTSAAAFGNQNKPMLSTVTRSDPQLLQYARLNYGSTQLTEEDWKKCEEHYKVNLLYQDMMRKRQEIDRLARGGKFKYEYDSDEDVDGGTWEHKLRCAEMVATEAWAGALTKQSEGKHHIGDFLPPEELKKFMEQYEAKKNNRVPDLSDYKEYKLREDNIGFQMLQKLGWKQGQGLGQDGAGIVDPVNKGPQREGNQGLGVNSAATPEDNDNEYDAYRKRMMLAYRFRPNPLNNPRRAYY